MSAIAPGLVLPDLPGLSAVGQACWARYGDERKRENARKLHAQTIRTEEVVEAVPWRIVLEPTNICNLRCASCSSKEGHMPRGMLTAANAAHFLRDLWPYLVQVNLFNYGEPLLNPELPEIIALLHDHGVGTHVHSNFNRLDREFADRIIDAGLDFLVASIDGVTQDVYERYRVGGSCERALANLAEFVRRRDVRGQAWPRIIWRMLSFPHNLHQINSAREMARELGTDDFAVAPGGLNGTVWTSDGHIVDSAPLADARPPYCRDLYDFPVIHWDGTLLPCCFANTPEFAWGHLTDMVWRDAFNNPGFRRARRLARGEPEDGPCLRCGRIPTRARHAAGKPPMAGRF